ncbi:MAG: tetratricopeptide repeat protein, partial [Chloroflexi bacterium]|nr:tetratricopeptide repeat protein [Chloroflexota bacterium]
QAIALALRNQWAEAAEVNRALLEMAPDDVEALNRLVKALLELGRYAEAREALEKVLRIAPHNTIARKNLDRLAKAEATGAAPAEKKVAFSLDLFMEEAGVSGVISLVDLGAKEVLQRLVGGEPVLLVPEGLRLTVRTRRDEHMGRVPPRLAQRLLSLMAGGNRYAGAILQASDQEIRLIIRQVYQHPSQVGKPSFPVPRPDGFRPYLRGRNLVYYELEEPGEAEELVGEMPARASQAPEEGAEEEEERE